MLQAGDMIRDCHDNAEYWVERTLPHGDNVMVNLVYLDRLHVISDSYICQSQIYLQQ